MRASHIITTYPMSGPSYDPIPSKAEMQRIWQSAADGWRQWSPIFQRWLLPASETALDMADIRAGDDVLDVAAGDGGQSTAAAARVGPSGSLLAVDFSARMLAYAAQEAAQNGLAQMQTRLRDAENLRLPSGRFDAVLCRAALPLFTDPLRALREALRVLKPGRKFVAMVFTTPERNPFFHLPGQNAAPAVFRLGGRGVLEDLFSRAGFRCVETRICAAPLRMPSADECLEWQKRLFHLMNPIHPSPDWETAYSALAAYETGGAFALPGEVLIASGCL